MTGRRARFAYAYGRLGARLGARPKPADWARLQVIADAASFTDAARRTPVFALMEGIGRDQPIHGMESALRKQWRTVVDQVARWHVGDDRRAIAWLALLALLPAIEHLAGGGAALPWMEADEHLAAFIEAFERKTDAATREPALAVFQPAFAGKSTASACWLAHWKTRWPAAPDERAELDKLVSAVLAKTGQANAALPSPDASERIFMAVLRKNPQSLVASAAYLGLVANDLRRLRGAVAVRLALPSLGGERAAA